MQVQGELGGEKKVETLDVLANYSASASHSGSATRQLRRSIRQSVGVRDDCGGYRDGIWTRSLPSRHDRPWQ